MGSALVPLLFFVYVNAMPSLVKHSRLLQFADDTTVICSGKNYVVRDNLNSDMDRIQAWIASSRMSILNVQKSSVMWFSLK